MRRATAGDFDSLDRLAIMAFADVASRRGGEALLESRIAGCSVRELVVRSVQGCPAEPGRTAEQGPIADLVVAAWLASWHEVDIGFATAVVQGGIAEQNTSICSGAGPSAAQRKGIIGCVWVEPEARELGAGSALLQSASAWLSAHEISEFDALALPGDRQAKNLLERAGFKARLIILRSSTQPRLP